MMHRQNQIYFLLLISTLFFSFSLSGCIKDMPREIVLKEKGKGRGACFGVIKEITDSQKTFATFRTPDGKGTYKVKTDKNGFFILNKKPGQYRLIAYSYVNDKGTVNINLAAGLPVDVEAGKIKYIGQVYSSPVDKNVYLVDNYIRDEKAFRLHYGHKLEIQSGFPNDEYYRLMKAHLAPTPPPPSVRSELMAKIETTVFLLGDVWPGYNVTLGETPNISEIPPHQVQIDFFSIDRHPVTNAQLARFIKSNSLHGYKACPGNKAFSSPGNVKPGWEDKPATCVSHEMAQMYCQSQGKRLPTEAQWELSARGKPWGNRLYGGIKPTSKPGINNGNLNINSENWKPSPYGIYFDGETLVEWVNDRYAPRYYQEGPAKNPTGPKSGSTFIARAGPYRFPLDKNFESTKVGFRCAKYQGKDIPELPTDQVLLPDTHDSLPSSIPDEIQPLVRVKKKAKIYQRPTIASSILEEVKAGTILVLIEQDAGWYRVRMEDGREGFLFEDFAKRIQ